MQEKSDLRFHVHPARIARALGWAIAILVACSLIGSFSAHVLGHGRLLGFVNEFNLGTERNVPTYFSTLLLFAAAVHLAVIAYAQTSSSRYRWHWIGLTFIFLFLSLDELASYHERLTIPTRALLGTGGWLYYAWVIPGTALLLLFGLVYGRFWLRLPSRSRWLFAFAGVVYITGAVGVEMTGGYYHELYGTDLTYELITTVEETLEMGGTAIFMYALIMYIGKHISSLSFYIDPKGDSDASPQASTFAQAKRSGYDQGTGA